MACPCTRIRATQHPAKRTARGSRVCGSRWDPWGPRAVGRAVAAPPEAAAEEAEATRRDGAGDAPGRDHGAEHGRGSAGERLGHTLTNLLGAAVVLLFAWV